MEKAKASFKKAWPYKDDALNLPVHNLEQALPYYETVMGFKLVSRKDSPYKSAIVERDAIQIGFAENGGDPTQEGCFFEVDSIEDAFSELTSRGLNKDKSAIEVQNHGGAPWKVFFILAPDGLCYCLGEKMS